MCLFFFLIGSLSLPFSLSLSDFLTRLELGAETCAIVNGQEVERGVKGE